MAAVEVDHYKFGNGTESDGILNESNSSFWDDKDEWLKLIDNWINQMLDLLIAIRLIRLIRLINETGTHLV